MNMKTKGLVAGVAGGALLLGTAGTFALWSDEATMSGAAITGGAFELSAGEIIWDLRPLEGEGKVPVPAEGATLVPGVQLYGDVSDAIKIELDGDLLVADLEIATGQQEVPDWLTVVWTLNGDPVTGPNVTLPNVEDGEPFDLAVSVSLTNQDGHTEADRGSDVAGVKWMPEDIRVTLQQAEPSFG